MVKKSRTCTYDFKYHLVWVTNYKENVFSTEEYQDSMKRILNEIADNNDIEIIDTSVMQNNVRLMISFPPKYSASQVVKTLKGGSARRWFKEFPETKDVVHDGKLWSSNFYISTVGNESITHVETYIQNQLSKYNGGRPRLS